MSTAAVKFQLAVNTLTELFDDSIFDEPVRTRLREHLVSGISGRNFFPTLRVREVCFGILADDLHPWGKRVRLYLAASTMMLRLLMERDDLRSAWRPPDMIRILSDTLAGLNKAQREILLLHLLAGLSNAEIAAVLQLDMVEELRERALLLLSDRLAEGKFTLDSLYAGGIGPVGEVTNVLEKVRRGESKLGDAVAADYKELLKLARQKLWIGAPPGFDAPSDLMNASFLRLPDNPDAAPQNRKELRALVGKIIYQVVIDSNLRTGKKRGQGAVHEQIEAADKVASDVEDQVLHQQLLEAAAAALERIRRSDKLAALPATNSLQETLLAALLKLRSEQPRQYNVLLLKIAEEKTNAECSEALGISPASVKRDFSAATRFLRIELNL